MCKNYFKSEYARNTFKKKKKNLENKHDIFNKYILIYVIKYYLLVVFKK